MSQPQIIGRLIARKKGATAFEIAIKARTTCPHKRVSELRRRGWEIEWHDTHKGYGYYTGKAPK